MNKLYCFFFLFTETHISLQSSVVIVRGISTNTTEDALLNYFENTRRSDGGLVEEVKITENTARVKFESSEGIFSFTYVTKPEKKDDVPSVLVTTKFPSFSCFSLALPPNKKPAH